MRLITPAAYVTQIGGVLLGLVVALFLSSSNFAIAHQFYLKTMLYFGFWPRYFVFLAVEVFVVGLCALYLAKREQRGLLLALCAIFAALPLYRVGDGHDMMMRASVPALFVFWLIVLNGLRGGGRHAATIACKVVVIAAIVIGAATPYMEIHRSLRWHKTSPPPIEKVKDMDNFDTPRRVAQYIGHRRGFFFRVLARPAGGGGTAAAD